MIYAIEAVGANIVKIGRSVNPSGRMDTLKTGSPYPLRLLAVVDWPDNVEGLIHRALADARMNGEWFEADPVVAEFVNTMMCPERSDDAKRGACMQILVERLLKGHSSAVESRTLNPVVGGSNPPAPAIPRNASRARTNAEKQRAYRERKKASDPDYLKRNAERVREARRKRKEGQGA